jgi:exonuclease SbcC
MRIEQISLSGFRGLYASGGSISVEIPDAELIAIVGANGSGKTTLIDNLHPYRLMPSRARSLSPRSFSFYEHTYGNATKELFFRFGGKRYRSLIEIDADRGKQSASLYEVFDFGERPVEIDGITSDGSVSTYDAIVERMFGDPEMYFSSVFIPQGKRLLSSLSPATIRSIFIFALEIERVRMMHEAAKAILRDTEAELQEKSTSLSTELRVRKSHMFRLLSSIRDKLGVLLSVNPEIDRAIPELEERLRAFSRSLEDESQRLGSLLAERDRLSQGAADVLSDLASCLVEIRTVLSRHVNYIDKTREIRERLEADRRALVSQVSEREAVSLEMEKVFSALAAHDGSLEPKESSVRAFIVRGEEALKLERATRDVPCSQELRGACPLYRPYSSQYGGINPQEYLQAKQLAEQWLYLLDKLSRLDLSIKSHESKVGHAEEALSGSESQGILATMLPLLRDKLKAISDTMSGFSSESISRLEASIAATKERLESTRAQKAELEVRIERLKKEREAYSLAVQMISSALEELSQDVHALGQLESVFDDVARVNRLIDVYKILRSALSESGIQTMLLTRGVETVGKIANDLLRLALSERFRLQFEFLRELKTGGTKMEFSLRLVDQVLGEARDVSTLSGGESVVVMEALSRALAIGCYGLRHGGVVETIIEDEADGALDGERCKEILLLKRAALNLGVVSQEIFVTHSHELSAGADVVLEAPLFQE